METRRRLATSGQREKERKSERHAPCTRTKQQPISAPLPPLVLFIFLCVCRQRRIDSTIKVHHHPPTHPPPSLLKALLKYETNRPENDEPNPFPFIFDGLNDCDSAFFVPVYPTSTTTSSFIIHSSKCYHVLYIKGKRRKFEHKHTDNKVMRNDALRPYNPPPERRETL